MQCWLTTHGSGGGLYLSFVTGFVQVRHFPDVLKSTVGGMFNKEEMKEETGKHHRTVCLNDLLDRSGEKRL